MTHHFGLEKDIAEYLDTNEKINSCKISISVDCNSLILKQINNSNLFIDINQRTENDSEYYKAGMLQTDFKQAEIQMVIVALKKIIKKYRCNRNFGFYAGRFYIEYDYTLS